MKSSPLTLSQRPFGIHKLALPALFAASMATAFAQDLAPDRVAIRSGDGKKVLTFHTVANGTWTIPAGVTEVEVLVVGGGGAGARGGAFGGPSGGSPGGGAGGLYYSTTYSVTPEATVNLAVGAGAPTTTATGSGANGDNSRFGDVIAYGGQGGQYATNQGGNQGGHSTDAGANVTPGYLGGTGNGATGGAGAGQNGRNGGFSPAYGGAGVAVPITGSAGLLDSAGNPISGIYGNMLGYAGGGSAGYDGKQLGSQYGESYGGGSGSEPEGTAGTSGFNILGGGGGGGRSANGGAGGSGVVIIAYTEPSLVTYTVTFESNGGSSVTSQIVPENTAATQPSNPTLTGYTFNGWFSDEALTQSYDFQTLVTSNITLYAKWTINTYTLTYTAGANGTITGDSPQTVEHGSSGTAVTAVPDSGYLFSKWSDDSTSNPRTDANVTGDITVTAIFELIPPPFEPDTVTTRGDGKTVATFSTVGSGTWTIPAGVSEVELLVVGGGGGGGAAMVSGGGGAGGVYHSSSVAVTPGGSYVVSVGAGGAIGGTGANSMFSNVTAFGGKPGQGNDGSGGASGGYSVDGGAAEGIFAGGGPNFWIGGGGGAAQAGFNGLGDYGAPTYNSGGNGLQVSITGTPTYYGGGGGNTYVGGYKGNEDPPIFNGGLGGGGAGDASSDGGGPATAGVNGLGGGGGGGRNTGGAAGGSGVVIVAYTLPTTLTTVELDSDVNPSTEGSSVTFTATVKDGGVTATAATGTFEFKVDDVVVEAAASIVNGVATYTTSSLAVGARSVTATYSGDSTYGSSFATMTQTVNAATADPYDTWASASGYNLTGGRDDDDDGDGVSNFQEFAFGLDPTDGASSNPIVDISQLITEGKFTFTKHVSSNLEYKAMISDDLQEWVTVAYSADPGEPDPDTGAVLVFGTLFDAPSGQKFFLRIAASEPVAPQ